MNVTNRPSVRLQEYLREAGFPAPEPKVSDAFAPNLGQWAIPQFLTFQGLVNMVTRSFRYTFDEAQRESPNNARAMRRDPVLMDALRSRQIPLCQLSWHIEPIDQTDPAELYAAANVTGIVKDIPMFHWMKLQLSEATWYGRYGVQYLMRPDFNRGYKRWLIKDHRPINGDKLVFKWSSEVGALVHPLYEGTTEVSERGLTHFFTPEERQCVIIHNFEPEDVDWYDYQMAGGIEGVGVRSRLYYFWYLKSKLLQYLLDYMQRVGLGIDAFYYDAGNPASLNEMKIAAQSTIGSFRLLLPRGKDGTGPGYQHFEAGHAGAQIFISFLSEYFDSIMRQYIIGQTLTTEVGSTGLGSGVAEAHQMTQEMIIQYDATALAETLTNQLLTTIYRWNHPGVPIGKFVFDVEKPNSAEYMEAAQMLYEMGVAIDADDLRSVLGLPRPEPGHDIASKFQQSAAATVGIPSGTPVESAGGSQDQQQAGGQEVAQQQQGQYPQSVQQYRRKFGPSSGFAPIGPAGYGLRNVDGSPLFGADNGDGIIERPVNPLLRDKLVYKAADKLAALRHNRNGRKSWSTVS